MVIRSDEPLWPGDLDPLLDRLGAWTGTPVYPPANLWEDEEALHLEMELPGLALDDLEITTVGRQLTIRGERKDPGDPADAYQRRERIAGAFVRTLELPYEIDRDGVQAVLEDGVLEVTLPKGAEARPRRIAVRSAGQERTVEAVEVKRKED